MLNILFISPTINGEGTLEIVGDYISVYFHRMFLQA